MPVKSQIAQGHAQLKETNRNDDPLVTSQASAANILRFSEAKDTKHLWSLMLGLRTAHSSKQQSPGKPSLKTARQHRKDPAVQ